MSSPTVSQVLNWASNSHVLGDASAGLDASVDAFDAAMNDLLRDVDAVSSGWKGDAARSSRAATDSEKEISNRLGIGMLDITDGLNELGPDFAYACDVARRVVDDITARGFTVADNGIVSPPAGTAGIDVPADPSRRATALDAALLTERMHRALSDAGEADAALAARVAAAASALSSAAQRATTSFPVSPSVRAILDGHSDFPTDPAALHSFWTTLTANEKAELWNHDREIGNSDGIPAADRDHFNRRHLVEMQVASRAELDRIGPPPSGTPDTAPRYLTGRPTPAELRRFQKWRDWHDRYVPAKARIDALDSLDAMVTTPSPTPRFLLVHRADGRVAVAVGNPDTARNVATFVPGTGTGLSTISANTERAQAMVTAATRADSHATASVIAWQDYRAPQTIFPQAADIDYARAAATGLDRFQNGLAATHLGDHDAHSSVLGHSYGGTVVSSAATGGHVLDTDDVIMVATPGMDHGATSPRDLALTGVPAADMDRRVWSTTSDDDMINAVPEAILGPKPTNGLLFHGAQQFESDPDGDHSGYWDPGNPALDNIGAIIAGRYDAVTR